MTCDEHLAPLPFEESMDEFHRESGDSERVYEGKGGCDLEPLLIQTIEYFAQRGLEVFVLYSAREVFW